IHTAENTALAQANENQREAYERCLDEVANHVVQALLNQKDLREECIKLKMRVFDLERQNKTLTELFTQKLSLLLLLFPISPPTTSVPPSSPVSSVVELFNDECTQNGTGGSPQASASSMEAMSPFLKKKAHILEVLRKLEESDPLKFHPSACYYYHGQALLPGETTVVTPSTRQPHCRHSSSDSDIHEYANGEGAQQDSRASLRYGGCPSCRILSQRSSLDSLLKCNQVTMGSHSGRDESQTSSEEHSASAQSTHPQTKMPDKANQPSTHNRANVTHFSQPKATVPYLSSLTADSSEIGEEPKHDRDKISPTKSKGANSGSQDVRQCDSIPTRADECRYLEVATDSVKHEHDSSVCNGVFSSNEASVSKKASVESYSPTTSAIVQQQATGKGKFLHSPTSPPSSFSESKPSPVSSPSKLLKFLKIPSMAENTPTANALRLSPQLTRSSKIPCRNNYEVYQSPVMSRKATTTERDKPSSASKTDTYPGTSQSSSQPHKGTQVPHYENILDPSASHSINGFPQITPEEMDLSDKQKISLRDERLLSPLSLKTSDSSATTGESPSDPSDQDTDTESPVWQRPQHHFSLDKQPSLPKRTVTKRLAALGKLKSTEDLQQAVEKREVQSNMGKTGASPGNNERSKTAERIAMEQRHSKYTDSLDGKPYPKTSFGNYSKASGSSSHEQSTKPVTAEKNYIAKVEGQKIKMGMSSTSSCETPVVMRSYGKCPNPLTHHSKTVPSPQSSPTRVQSKSPSKAGNASSYPRGMKPVQDERSHPQRHTSQSANIKTVEEKRPSAAAPAPQSAIEQKVMRGIEENMLKLQEQDRGQAAETKQKTSNGIASWFGLKKSKLPALNRKPEMSKLKINVSSSSGAKDASGAKGGPRKVVESLNISKLMEKAEDLRKALEEERAYVNRVGIALDRPGRGHSCEVVMDQAQGQLSLMYRGVTADSFMQQLLNSYTSFQTYNAELSSHSGRMDRNTCGCFQILSSLIFLSVKDESFKCCLSANGGRFGELQGCLTFLKEPAVEMFSNRSDPQLFCVCCPPGSGSSMRTLDSGIGTFPLPDYASSAAGKGIPKPQGDQGFSTSQGKQGALLKAPRKARTLERELSSLDEVNPCVLYTSPLEAKGPAMHLSSTIHEGVGQNWLYQNVFNTLSNSATLFSLCKRKSRT
uniref:Nck-associated protein 5 C-terminal domain-containing protein n=1 Tax=Pygocentrus nattereri TaxID=42514 RepID=A0A3B4DHS3_PYGNA